MAKYENYRSNLEALQAARGRDLSDDLIASGVISKFALQFELAWKLLQKTLQYEGRADAESGSPRSILKLAHATYDFIPEEPWLAMLADRNAAMHVYDAALAQRLAAAVMDSYLPLFEVLLSDLEALYGSELLKSL